MILRIHFNYFHGVTEPSPLYDNNHYHEECLRCNSCGLNLTGPNQVSNLYLYTPFIFTLIFVKLFWYGILQTGRKEASSRQAGWPNRRVVETALGLCLNLTCDSCHLSQLTTNSCHSWHITVVRCEAYFHWRLACSLWNLLLDMYIKKRIKSKLLGEIFATID